MRIPTENTEVKDQEFLKFNEDEITLELNDPQCGVGAERETDATLALLHVGHEARLYAAMRYHCLGVVEKTQLSGFFLACQLSLSSPVPDAGARVGLYDYDQLLNDEKCPSLSGVEVVFEPQSPSLRIEISPHCFGRIEGPVVLEFLRSASRRFISEPEPEAAAA